MQQLFPRTPNKDDNIQFFSSHQAASGSPLGFTHWTKPATAKLVMIISHGSGGGGGKGNTAAAGSAAAGAGGGGGGARSVMLVPADYIPGDLYLLGGRGGTGSTSTNGAAGLPFYVMYAGDIALPVESTMLKSGNASAGGGAQSGTAGTAETVGSVANCPSCTLGITHFISGKGGTAGGSSAAGTAQAMWDTGVNPFAAGGTGGGGVSAANATFAGGAATKGAFMDNDMTGGTAGGGAGNGAYHYEGTLGDARFPWTTVPATGGGSNTGASSVGGRGGQGNYGCGGGGGGGANGASSVSGNGGDGGPGFVWFICK